MTILERLKALRNEIEADARRGYGRAGWASELWEIVLELERRDG